MLEAMYLRVFRSTVSQSLVGVHWKIQAFRTLSKQRQRLLFLKKRTLRYSPKKAGIVTTNCHDSQLRLADRYVFTVFAERIALL